MRKDDPTEEQSAAPEGGPDDRARPPQARPKKAGPEMVLRLGIIREGRVVSERLVPRRRSVSLGAVTEREPLEKLGISPGFELLAARKGGYDLQFDEKLGGKVWLGTTPFTLDSLRAPGRAKSKGKVWTLPIDPRVRGKIEVGPFSILFHFVPGKTKEDAVAPPYDPFAPLWNRRGLAKGAAIVGGVSIAVHVVLVVVLSLRTPRVVDDEHWVDIQMSVEEQAEETDEQQEQAEPEPDDVVVPQELADQILTEAPPQQERQQEPELARPLSEEARRDRARQQAREQSVLGAFGGGPEGAALPDVFGLSNTDGWTLGGKQARGDGGLASLGGAGASVFGTEGAATPAAVNVSAPVGVARQAATQVEASEERERVRVTSEVRQSEARTAGAGRVENLSQELRRRVRDVERCYERALPDDPDLGGRINLQFDIGSDGRVEDAILTENEVGDVVGDCVLREVRQWRFDRPEGGTLTVRKAYLLQPSGD